MQDHGRKGDQGEEGAGFLPNTSMEYLKRCRQSETNFEASIRLLAHVQGKEGKTMD